MASRCFFWGLKRGGYNRGPARKNRTRENEQSMRVTVEGIGIGPLLIIGGHEDKEGDRTILKRVVHLAGAVGGRARIGVVTTASEAAEKAFNTYERVFTDLGAEVVPLDLKTRREADAERALKLVPACGAIFFTGGDQLRITSMLGGTRFHWALQEAHRQGTTVAGTSAGASMMSETMIVEGYGEKSPTRNTVKMAPGMGLWTGAVIDQHFTQRGRINRLLSALAQNPDILAVGLDEDTAIEVRLEAGRFRVMGSRTVTILDGRSVDWTNASEQSPEEPLTLTHVHLHVLSATYGFDFKRRMPVPPDDDPKGDS